MHVLTLFLYSHLIIGVFSLIPLILFKSAFEQAVKLTNEEGHYPFTITSAMAYAACVLFGWFTLFIMLKCLFTNWYQDGPNDDIW